MSSSTADGCFNQPSYLGVNDPYQPPEKGPVVHAPGKKDILTTVAKTGQTANNWGAGTGTFAALSGQYIDMNKVEAKYRLEGRNKFLTPNGFRYSNGRKASSSKGDYFGTFQKAPHEHMPDGLYKPRGPLEKITEPLEKRNIVTRPVKKGTYGFRGTTIGQEYLYVSTPFNQDSIMRKEEREIHQQQVGERKPFRPGGGSFNFDKNAAHSSEPSAIVTATKSGNDASMKETDPADQSKPFRPAGASKGTFNSFPEMVPEPYDEIQKRNSMLPSRRLPIEKSAAESNLPEKLLDRKPFRPGTGPKTKLTRSIQLMDLNLNKEHDHSS